MSMLDLKSCKGVNCPNNLMNLVNLGSPRSVVGFLLNPFHLVEVRPWPLVGSVGALLITVGFVG